MRVAEQAEQSIRQMGPPKPNPPPDLSRFNPAGGGGYGAAAGYEYDDDGNAPGPMSPHQQPMQPQPTVVVAAPPRPVVPVAAPARPMARGLYAFAAQSPQELSFNPGDVLAVVSQDGQWWTAELNGRRGLIPSNYVQLM